jgi:hypothetical protein
MLSLFVDIHSSARHATTFRVTFHESMAARNLMKFASAHATGAKTLSGGAPWLVDWLLVRRAHLSDLEAWFSDGVRSFGEQLSQLKDVVPWYKSRRLLRAYRFPRLSKLFTDAYKAIPPQIRKQQMDARGLPVVYNGSDLMRIFSVTPDTLTYWKDLGLIPSKSSPDLPYRIPFSALDRIQTLHDQGCTQEEASEILGCSTDTVIKLIRLKAIGMTGFRAKYLFDRPSRASLASLSESFLERSSLPAKRSRRISFEELVATIRTPFQWKRFCSLTEGTLHVLLKRGGIRLCDVSFLRSELAENGFI